MMLNSSNVAYFGTYLDPILAPVFVQFTTGLRGLDEIYVSTRATSPDSSCVPWQLLSIMVVSLCVCAD